MMAAPASRGWLRSMTRMAPAARACANSDRILSSIAMLLSHQSMLLPHQQIGDAQNPQPWQTRDQRDPHARYPPRGRQNRGDRQGSEQRRIRIADEAHGQARAARGFPFRPEEQVRDENHQPRKESAE